MPSAQATYDLFEALHEQQDYDVHEALAQGAILDPTLWRGGLAQLHQDGELDAPIFTAASAGSTVCLRILLDAGGLGQLELPDRHGMRPLHHACRAGCLEPAELLILAGAEIDARDGEGRTPAMLAAAAPYEVEGFMRSLAANGADFRLLDDQGRSVLSRCAPGSPASAFLASWLARAEAGELGAHVEPSGLPSSPAPRV